MFQGDKAALPDKLNVMAQRQRRSIGQLATDVVARSSFADVGDLVVGHGADKPGRVPVGADGAVLTAQSRSRSGVEWHQPPVEPTTGVGATAALRASRTSGYTTGARGEMLHTPDITPAVTLIPVDSLPWFVDNGSTITIPTDSLMAFKLEATVEIPHAPGLLLPDRFCHAHAVSWGSFQGVESSMGVSVRPDLDAPIQLDAAWGDSFNFGGGDALGYADWAYDSATCVIPVLAGITIGLHCRFVSTTIATAPGTTISVSLFMTRIGDLSLDSPRDFFNDYIEGGVV